MALNVFAAFFSLLGIFTSCCGGGASGRCCCTKCCCCWRTALLLLSQWLLLVTLSKEPLVSSSLDLILSFCWILLIPPQKKPFFSWWPPAGDVVLIRLPLLLMLGARGEVGEMERALSSRRFLVSTLESVGKYSCSFSASLSPFIHPSWMRQHQVSSSTPNNRLCLAGSEIHASSLSSSVHYKRTNSSSSSGGWLEIHAQWADISIHGTTLLDCHPDVCTVCQLVFRFLHNHQLPSYVLVGIFLLSGNFLAIFKWLHQDQDLLIERAWSFVIPQEREHVYYSVLFISCEANDKLIQDELAMLPVVLLSFPAIVDCPSWFILTIARTSSFLSSEK